VTGRRENAGLPLDGVTVVALEQAVAAPFATRQLADLGARVIKVERPGTGDFARQYDHAVLDQASYFVWLNRGKESVALDLKDERDRAVVAALLQHADVFVHNLKPGAVERLGFGAPTLRPSHPRLITCAVSGFGAGGPYGHKKAYDLMVQCEGGLLSVTGDDQAPAKVGISIADIAAGMYAYSGILTALYERERSGKGTDLSVAMLEALGEWMSQPNYYFGHGRRPVQRTGARHASIAPYGPYRAGESTTVFIAVQNDREWKTFCENVLRRSDLVEDPRFVHNVDRVANNDELFLILEAAFQSIPAQELTALLDDAAIANARLRSAADLENHPQLAARDRWREVDTPNGAVRALLPPVTVQGRECAMGAVPALGAHTEAVLTELGMTR
jgi:itaconate CoA-transferase